MAILSKSHIWNSPRLDSKIKSRNVSSAEKWVGYLFAPLGPFLFQALVAQYLNVYYTDVMGATKWLGGGFLIMYPIVSKILDAITNVIMGMLIDRTRTRQGKLRPYILMSAPLLTLSGLLLFMVPNWSETGQVIWVMFTYNFYCAVAFTMFFISSNLLVPNASRNSMQRTQLSVFNNIANVAGTGIIVALLIPMLVMPVIGVDKSKWILVMSIFAVLIFPCVILMYFFTRERVTEEDLTAGVQEKVPVGRQLKAMFTDKYWLLIMGFYLIFNICGNCRNIALPYYCNWVLGTYSDGITQTLVNALGGLPMGIGMLAVWPLAKKFGKKNLTAVGLVVYAIGSGICFFFPRQMIIVLIGQFLKNMGYVPIAYIFMSLIADILDTLEYKNGFRVDGLSGSVYTIITTVSAGIATSIFNSMLSSTGYVAPYLVSPGVYNTQNAACQSAITWCFLGFEAIGGLVLALMVSQIKVEKNLPAVIAALMERKRRQAEENGLPWVDPVEEAKREEQEAAALAEEKRLEKLRARCQKKGLDFERENARYLEKRQKKSRKKEKAQIK